MLAKLGYVAFVADVYGKGVRPTDTKGAIAESSKYMKDRPLLRARAQAAFDQLSQEQDGRYQEHRSDRLLLWRGRGARARAQRRAAQSDTVTFHGDITSPTPDDDKNIKGRVLALARCRRSNRRPQAAGRLQEGNDRRPCRLGDDPLQRRGSFLHPEVAPATTSRRAPPTTKTPTSGPGPNWSRCSTRFCNLRRIKHSGASHRARRFSFERDTRAG